MEDKLKTLLALAFPSRIPSMMAPKKESIDYNRMSDEEYYASPHFQGQGRLAESYPVASVVGPLKGANMLRQWLLKGMKPKPSPISAISAISLADQEDDSPEFEERIAEWMDPENQQLLEDSGVDPERLFRITNRQIDTHENLNTPRLTGPPDRLRLEGPPNLLRLTYNPDPDEAPVEEDINITPRVGDHAMGLFEDANFAEWMTAQEEDEAGYEQHMMGGDDGDFDEPDWDADAAVNFDAAGNRWPNDGSLVSDKEFYTPPKGYYSALSKIIAGDTLTKAEKESAVREIKYSNISYDRKHFDINDPYSGLDLATEVDESGNILPSAVPSLTDPEAIKKFKEERPLEFTVRQSDDYVGNIRGGTKASHLYFDSNQEGAQHFFSDGRAAQAFITYNQKGGTFNVEESQSEVRGKGNTFNNQVITKLAQETVLRWADSGLSTLTIPTGEAIFEKYYSTAGKGLWGDERNLLNTQDDEEFAEKAFAFYNQPLIQTEARKDVYKHKGIVEHLNNLRSEGERIHGDGLDEVREIYGHEYANLILEVVNKPDDIMEHPGIQDAVDLLTLQRADKLKGLRSNYQGKVKHYNEYVKQVKKALKQHGANLFDEESDKKTRLKITNPEETIRKTKKDGFTMAMNILKGIADRQVA